RQRRNSSPPKEILHVIRARLPPKPTQNLPRTPRYLPRGFALASPGAILRQRRSEGFLVVARFLPQDIPPVHPRLAWMPFRGRQRVQGGPFRAPRGLSDPPRGTRGARERGGRTLRGPPFASDGGFWEARRPGRLWDFMSLRLSPGGDGPWLPSSCSDRQGG